MTRLVIHAGFHKTGTTSVQSTLRANAARLETQLRVYLKEDFELLADATRHYSAQPSDESLAAVGRYALRFFRRIGRDDPRPVLMSSEDLSGHMPGRLGLRGYDAAPRIMATLAENARHWFGDDLDLTFFFSTRERDSWLRSTWWQNLRSTRLVEDLDDYADRIAGAADLPQVLVDVANAVGPARVASALLEDSRALAQGPLTPLLDLAEFPEPLRDSLDLLPPENVQPEIGLDDVFLALNRSRLKDKYLREAKKNLRQMANRQREKG